MAAMVQPSNKAKKIADKILGRKKEKASNKSNKEPESTAEQSYKQLADWRQD
jgi:hypothetical protein